LPEIKQTGGPVSTQRHHVQSDRRAIPHCARRCGLCRSQLPHTALRDGSGCRCLWCGPGCSTQRGRLLYRRVLGESSYQKNSYTPVPKLVCVEQTHNFAGGKIWPLAELTQIRELAHSQDLKVHMDGARLFNAAVASGIAASEFAAQCDTVWVDFTKGLGAPLGAVLCGEVEFIEKHADSSICSAVRSAKPE
jgi:hypothetical protein